MICAQIRVTQWRGQVEAEIQASQFPQGKSLLCDCNCGLSFLSMEELNGANGPQGCAACKRRSSLIPLPKKTQRIRGTWLEPSNCTILSEYCVLQGRAMTASRHLISVPASVQGFNLNQPRSKILPLRFS
jgi:hypothetical protein